MIAKRIATGTAILVAASAGAYFFIYLYRWEWNRALIAAALFIAVEILIVTNALMGRLKRMEEKLDGRIEVSLRNEAEQPLASDPLAQLKQTAPPPGDRFAWLAGEGELKVFVPVLMGAGFVLSAVAWGVERISRATANPALEKKLATRLAHISLPQGALVGLTTVALPSAPARHRAFPLRGLLVVLCLSLVLIRSLDLLADLTQGRADPPTTGTVSEVVMELSHKNTMRSPLVTARSLLAACELSVPKHIAYGKVRVVDPYTVAFTISPGLGPHEEKRMRGCLQDVTMDNVQGTVSRFATHPIKSG